jgi:hypothetical protein
MRWEFKRRRSIRIATIFVASLPGLYPKMELCDRFY